MKKFVKDFDVHTAHIVGRIPAQAHGMFDLLGYITSPPVWMMVIGIVVWLLHASGGDWRQGALVLVCIPLGAIIKLFVRRERPPTVYAEAMRIKSYSFPSSHAFGSMVAGGYCLKLALQYDILGLAAAMACLIVLIGVSRVHLGAHYPSDVLAGWVLGALLLVLA